MSKKSRITLLIPLATALLLLYSDIFATKKTVDADGGSSYTTLSAAISFSTPGDTIYIQGSDIDTYDEAWPNNIGWVLTFMSDKTNPDSFPSIRFAGSEWDKYWVNFAGTNRFERVVLNNCGTIVLTFGGRNCIINKCVIKNYSSNVFTLGSNTSNYLTITNTIFWNNTGTIFPQLADHNSSGPYGTVFNCTFYGNSIINSESNVSSTDVAFKKIVVITNSIFKGNSTIASDADIKTAYTYNLLPSSESGWGTGSVYNDNPGFINSSPAKASDFGLQSSSPAKDFGTNTGAPSTDITGGSRSGTYDIGAYEYGNGGGNDYTWDNSTTSGIQVSSGTWGSDNYWTITGSGGTSLISWQGEGKSATFAGGVDGGPYTITVSGTQNVDSITFLNNTYNLSGGTLNFGTKPGVYVESGKTAAISTVISGTPGLSKYGTGTLTISGSNTYTGNTVINAGTLKNGATNTFPMSTGLVIGANDANNATYDLNGYIQIVTGISDGGTTGGTKQITNTGSAATLVVNNSTDYSYSYLITNGTNALNLIKNGSAKFTFAGSNSFTGTMTINAGVLSCGVLANGGSNSNIGASSNTASNLVINGGTLQYTGAGVSSDRLFTIGTNGGTIDASGTGALNLTNIGTMGRSGTGTRTLTLTGSNTGNNTLTAIVSNDASSNATSITKSGSGRWVLSGSNTATGPLNISAGTLIVNGSTASGCAVAVSSGAVLAGTGIVGGTVNVANGGIVSPGTGGTSGTLKTGALTLNGTSVLNYDLGTNRDSIRVNGNLVLDGTLNINNLAGFAQGNYTLMTYTGTLTNNTLGIGSSPSGYTCTISTATPGSVILTVNLPAGANCTWDISTFAGIQAYNVTWGTNNYWTKNGGTVLNAWTSYDNAIFAANQGGGAGGGYADDHGDGTFSGWTSRGTRVWSETGGFAVPQNNISNRGFLTNDYNCSNDGTYIFILKGPGNTNSQFGGGIFRFTDTTHFYCLSLYEGYTGGASTDNAIKFIKNSLSWSSGTLVKNNLNFSGMNSSYKIKVRLSGSTITFWLYNPGTSSWDSLNQITDSDNSSGKVGYGYDSYNTWVSFDSSSWADASSPGNPGPYTITVNGTQSVNTITFNATGYTLSGGTLNMAGASSPAISTAAKATIGSVVDGSNGLQKNGNDTLVLTGTNTWTGGTTISAGVLQIGSGGAAGTLPGDVNNNSILIINRSDLFYFDGVISGTGSLIKTGGNVLVLSRDNTYTGPTTISSGALLLGNGGASGSVSGNIINNSILSINRTGIISLSGVISGSGTLVKNGSGTLILGGVNTYSGTTTVSVGELRISGSTSASSAVTVQSGATLSGSGTVNGSVTISNGGIISPGNGSVGTLTTGILALNSTSNLNFDLGISRDSIKVNGNLTLDGNLNIANAGEFGPGVYTLITYTGSCTDAGLSINTVPLNSYTYSITVNTGTKKVLLTVSTNTSMLPLTVVQAAPKCSVYTSNWTLVFDNGKGGGINVLADSIHGISHGQGNQIGGSQNLYYLEYDAANSTQNGSWSILGLGSFWTTIRQSGTLAAGITYTNDYTINGSGKIFIKSTINNSGSGVAGKTVHLACERRPAAVTTVTIGNSSASQSPYVLLSSDSSKQNDILLSIKDLWAAAAAIPNSATGFYNSTATGYAGYECNSFSLASGQRQSWEFMIDFAHQDWNDSNGVGMYSDDYRTPDSLTYIVGTPAMEQDWEQHLCGHWKFDETGTVDTARDASGCNRFGLISGGSWTTGKLGGGLQLNGSQSVTVQNNSDYNGFAYFTVMAWIKPSAAISSGSVIIGKHNGTQGWKLTGDAGKLSVTLDGSTVSGTSTGIGTGTWHHVAVSWRAPGTVVFYIDGKVDKVQTGSYTVTNNTANVTVGSGFNGIIDDVRYYNGYEGLIPENTLESIYRNGIRSAEGVYDTRASNDNTLHVLIDGKAVPRRFPVFRIANYWATSKPAAGCVRLNGTALTEGTDYYADLIDGWNLLYIGLNKTIIDDTCRLFIDDASTKGVVVRTTPKIVWGKQNNGSIDYFWVKNFSDGAFGSSSANQWYVNWKMSENDGKDGDPWFMASSVTNPRIQVDTTILTNLIPAYNIYSNDSWGDYCFAINWYYPKTSADVSSPFTYTVEESSSVRVVLRVNERNVVNNGSSYKVQSRWTIYPTGQFFKWDSLYQFSSAPSQVYASACMRDTTYSSFYVNKPKKRGGVIYSSNFQDYAYAWLSMRNAGGYQAQPFGSDTILTWKDATRVGMDFGDYTATSAWNSSSIQSAVYLDMQNTNMNSVFIDSASNSVQYPQAPVMIAGTLLNGGSATEGDLNGDGFNERDGAYVFASNNNVVHFRLPAHGDTCRFHPVFRITGYSSTYKPQYVVIYRGADTVTLSEGCHYNAYLSRTKKELVIQIDSVFHDTTNIFISSDKTLAVKLSQFSAQGGDGCDTLRWRTESEQENLGFYLYRRVCPVFLDSLKKIAEKTKEKDTFYKKIFKDKEPESIDTEWVRVNNSLISGALSGASYGPRDYVEIDYKVQNGILYEYKLVALDYANKEEYYGPIKVMPRRTAPAKFALFRNYPNPFRCATMIKFALPEKSRVSINIYSLQGRLVRRLVVPDKVFGAGIYHVAWNGENELGRPLPAGPYVYRFETGKFADAKVMLFIRR